MSWTCMLAVEQKAAVLLKQHLSHLQLSVKGLITRLTLSLSAKEDPSSLLKLLW